MPTKETIVFGVPVPSDDQIFLTIVVIHILLGIVCVFSGLFAMLSNKMKGTHTTAGKIYYFGMLFILVTIIPLAIMRWPYNTHLLIVGTLAFLFTYLGRRLAHYPKPGWTRLHTIFMGLSYVLLLTGFYVDNGKNLPFWNQFPQLFFWIFPSAIGIPVIIYALLRHPLNRRNKK
jgi:hypothetical protein